MIAEEDLQNHQRHQIVVSEPFLFFFFCTRIKQYHSDYNDFVNCTSVIRCVEIVVERS